MEINQLLSDSCRIGADAALSSKQYDVQETRDRQLRYNIVNANKVNHELWQDPRNHRILNAKS